MLARSPQPTRFVHKHVPQGFCLPMLGELRRAWSSCTSGECTDGDGITGIVICLHVVDIYICLQVFIHIYHRQVYLNGEYILIHTMYWFYIVFTRSAALYFIVRHIRRVCGVTLGAGCSDLGTHIFILFLNLTLNYDETTNCTGIERANCLFSLQHP